eukprot:183692_1
MSVLHVTHSRLAKRRKQYLVCGYIKHQQHELTLTLPMDIINLVYQFFEQVFYWHVQDDALKQFKSKRNTDTLVSTPFCYNRDWFQCGLFPNGRLPSQLGFVVFYISMPNISHLFEENPDIEQVIVYFELFCEETQSQWKGIRVYTNDNKKSAGWSSKTLPLRACNSFNDLWFSCYVKVLQIVHKQSPSIRYTTNCDPIRYEWLLSSNVSQDITSCNFGKTFFSNDFGNDKECRWILMMAPNLNTNSGKEMNKRFECLFICLRCIKLPKDMGTVKAQYLIECDWSDRKSTETTKEFSYDSNLSQWEVHQLKYDSDKVLDAISTLQITITIHIL